MNNQGGNMPHALRPCLWAMLLSAFLTTHAAAGEVWKITSLDWPPYAGSTMALQGDSIRKLRNLLRTRNIQLVVEFYPWARAQFVAQQEGYLGYFPAWPEEVRQGFTASAPVSWSEIAVLVRSDSRLEWKDLPTLFDRRVGLVFSYIYPESVTLMARERSENVDFSPNDLALLRKLEGGRFEAAITDPAVMLHMAEQEGIENIRVLTSLGAHPLVLAVRNTPENLKRLELLTTLLRENP